ncbi:MAG: hypothetical protein WA110_02390, partial [Anaerolineaceae bacterium]
LVALSHPTLNPSSSAQTIRRYSQQFIDLIDLKKNAFATLPVREVLDAHTPQLRFFAQVDSDGYIHSLRSNLLEGSPMDLVLTFDELLRHTNFPELMRELLKTLEGEYSTPIDVEFTAGIQEVNGKPKVQITLIQCRPLGTIKEGVYLLPQQINDADKVFTATSLVSGGTVQNIRYVAYVPPEAYFAIRASSDRYQLERAIGRLNASLKSETFICIGPGRWGTSNPDLGIHVDYADIFNSKALIELSGGSIGIATEPSLGTHFFQDLLEGQIYPLAINIGKAFFNQEFFTITPNRLSEWIEVEGQLEDRLHLIQVSDFRPKHHLDLVMDDSTGQALAFLTGETESTTQERQMIIP